MEIKISKLSADGTRKYIFRFDGRQLGELVREVGYAPRSRSGLVQTRNGGFQSTDLREVVEGWRVVLRPEYVSSQAPQNKCFEKLHLAVREVKAFFAVMCA